MSYVYQGRKRHKVGPRESLRLIHRLGRKGYKVKAVGREGTVMVVHFAR